jgi:hypothetical protein
MIDTTLQDFLPKTLDERLAKLRERLNQAWPTFSTCGGYDRNCLYTGDHEQGAVVRFYRAGRPITFDPVGAVKHGSTWYLSAPIGGISKFNTPQMQDYLSTNKLNWVIIL